MIKELLWRSFDKFKDQIVWRFRLISKDIQDANIKEYVKEYIKDDINYNQ